MNNMQKLIMAFILTASVFVLTDARASAAKTITGTNYTPASFRPMCSGGRPVDFAVHPSDVSFDAATGIMEYNINIRWQRCNATQTRAYAIYGGPEVCPVSGWYGVSGTATDCVKYIGSPAYAGAGNGLDCVIWGVARTNENCVTSVFSGARRSANQPSYTTESITIPMSAAHPNWASESDAANTWTITNEMCQYYKTGTNFTTHHTSPPDNHCETLTMSVSWVPTLVPPTITCGSASTSPSEPEPGENFTLNTSFSISGGDGQPTTLYSIIIDLAAAGVSGAYANAYASIPYAAGTGAGVLPNPLFSPSPVSISSPGQHSGTYTVRVNDAANTPLSCPFTVTIANKPYFKVYGGDVSVGKGMGTSCVANTSARIASWQRPYGGPFHVGSGSQLAAFALGSITDFASGQERYTESRKNLTFANSGGAGDATYGGGLNPAQLPCAAEYWAATPAGSAVPAAFNPSHQGVFRSGGSTTVSVNPGGIGTGRDVTVYVNGDAYISSNITYQSTNYGNIDDIPSFRLIVRGNIYVAPDVTELNGLYVATGRFYTCGRQYGPPTQAQLVGQCQTNRLTVYGAVIADAIKLNRTGGTLRQADLAEAWNPDHYATGPAGPAERFIYTPELWLTSQFTTGGDAGTYRNLPPVL